MSAASATSAAPAIELDELHKQYGGEPALRGLSLTVPRGSVFGLLGRNGAGKSTAVRILLGLQRADRGTGLALGHRIDHEAESVALRRRTAFVSETKALFPHFTVAQTLRFTRALYPTWDAARERHWLARFALPPRARVPSLSKGMRTKLALLLAFASGAELLVLDEPTDGLDPIANDEVLAAIVALVAEHGTTVLLASHQLHEVEQVADHVAIVERGRVVAGGELDELRTRYRRVRVVFDDGAPMPVLAAPTVEAVRRDGRTATLLVSGDAHDVVARARAHAAADVQVAPVTLRELFRDVVDGGAPR